MRSPCFIHDGNLPGACLWERNNVEAHMKYSVLNLLLIKPNHETHRAYFRTTFGTPLRPNMKRSKLGATEQGRRARLQTCAAELSDAVDPMLFAAQAKKAREGQPWVWLLG